MFADHRHYGAGLFAIRVTESAGFDDWCRTLFVGNFAANGGMAGQRLYGRSAD